MLPAAWRITAFHQNWSEPQTPLQGANTLRSEPRNEGPEVRLWLFHSPHRLCRQLHHQKNFAAAAKSLQSCPTLCDPTDSSPTRFPRPWDSPGKNTEVGCHFFLQCMKVKSESEITQSCPTLSDPMDCSLPGSCVHGILQARVLEWGAFAFKTQ